MHRMPTASIGFNLDPNPAGNWHTVYGGHHGLGAMLLLFGTKMLVAMP